MGKRSDETSRSAAITTLARDVIDDIELSRADVGAIVPKALRLARLLGDPNYIEWLSLEVQGYYANSGMMAEDYATRLGRYTDKSRNLGYFGPIAEIDASIRAHSLQLQTLRVPDIDVSLSSANPNRYVGGGWGTTPAQTADYTIQKVVNEARSVAATVATLTGIRTRVIGWIHTYATTVYQERIFSGLSESIFEKFKLDADELLAARAGDALDRLPAVSARLSEGDAESVSQALLTCRRILDAFVDQVFPPTAVPRTVDGRRSTWGQTSTRTA